MERVRRVKRRRGMEDKRCIGNVVSGFEGKRGG